jgi:sugar lactone lactonase YvrE
VAVDAVGNLYIADYGNQRIRKVDTNGIISTVAGNGTNGYSGDSGAAANAELNSPLGVAVDAVGNLYISDSSNQRIRKVDTNGVITTVAGNGTNGYSGDGGAAIGARLNRPSGTVFDGFGNLYIADGFNSRIRKVDASGFITTVAGNGTATFAGDGGAATSASLDDPTGAALDAAGNLYIADNVNNRIRKVLLSAGYPAFTVNNVSVVNAGSYTIVITSPYGSVTSAVASLTVEAPPIITLQPTNQTVLPGSSPAFSVTVAGSGPIGYSWYFGGANLLQSGTNNTLTLSGVSAINGGNYTVVITNAYGSVTSQVAALAVLAPPLVITQPASQTVLSGTNVIFNVTLANTGPSTYQWQLNGTDLPNNIITTVAGNGTNGYSGDGGAASNAQLSQPNRMALDAAGNLYITDTSNNRVRKVDTNGVITTVAGGGSGGDGGPAANAILERPTGITLDSGGNLYIADTVSNRIRRVDTYGIITTVAGNGTATFAGDGGAATNASLSLPYGVAFDVFGRLYIADTANNRIRKVDTSGVITTVAGESSSHNETNGNGGAATNAWLLQPSGLAFDALGNLYIAQVNSAWVRKVDANGIITAAAGIDQPGFSGDGGAATSANLDGPFDVAADSLGDFYIADSLNNRIRKVDANGIISTVAGNGSGTYAGDGGAATNASLSSPSGVAFDAAGNLYIADTYNNRIREVLLSASYPTLTIPNVSLTNAGSYTLVVSNTYGVVTSAVAALNVAVARPQIMTSDGGLGFVANQFGFNLSGATGQTIVVDGSGDLVNWTPLCTNTVGSGPLYFCDPCWTNFGWRFYRVRLP